MNTLPIMLFVLCVFAIMYRYYSAFLAARALVLDDSRQTPAHVFADGHNYVASPKWVLFGHHFAAIAGAGPLVGPTLAAQLLINMGKTRVALTTALPMLFVGVTTLSAGVLSIRDVFWPLTQQPGKQFQGYLDTGLMVLFITGVVLVVFQAARRCLATLNGQPLPADASGAPVPPDGPKMTCC